MALPLTLAQASAAARRSKWADSTRSIGILVLRNGREREYLFDRRGRVVGRIVNGETFDFDHPWTPRG